MKYLSVCSGIEAATVAWHSLGWTPLAFSEIEAFPRAVLQHHYPDVPLYGDFTKLRDEPIIEDADILVGGTPCQAFSVAGLRKSLGDDRGNLTLEFVRLADAIDNVRLDRGKPASIIVWENVPGVLSVKDNAFGCFLAALAGDDTPYVPPRGKWTNAGVVAGPKRTVAWRVLDAQYFGLAQRRRRVFVVASARDGFDPAAVLLECEGVRRDTSPRDVNPVSARQTVGTVTTRTGNANDNYSAEVGHCLVHTDGRPRWVTVTEVERFQGFPDGYTNIPWRKKSEAPDGLRYRALGNSMAVPIMRWIGQRIARIGDDPESTSTGVYIKKIRYQPEAGTLGEGILQYDREKRIFVETVGEANG